MTDREFSKIWGKTTRSKTKKLKEIYLKMLKKEKFLDISLLTKKEFIKMYTMTGYFDQV